MSMAETTEPVGVIHPSRIPNRWVQLIAGIVAMMAIANLQYAWTLFTKPIQSHLHVTLPAVQGVFAAFILIETWLVPFEGALIDRVGPRLMLGIGGIFIGLGWLGSGYAETLRGLYFWYCLGGLGAGFVYGGTIGNALKWFPDFRGLCVGMTAGAYGIGTAISVAPIADMIKTSGYQHTFIVFGIIQGVVVLFAALFLAKPPQGWVPENWAHKQQKIKAAVPSTNIDVGPLEMVQTSSFWMIYFMMTLVAFGGLVVTAQLNPMAVTYKVDKVVVFAGMTALVLAIEVDRLLNGLTRPFWGWVSDHIGRENTMFIAFMAEALAVFALLQLIHRPLWFITLSGLCFFAWGEIFSLFPAITGDLFGRKWATTNYGIVYTAKGTAALFAAPGAAWLFSRTGSWTKVFWIMIACDVIAALLALFWLKPVARRTIRQTEANVSRAVGPVRPVQGAA
jgi:MFS transporter, OFA family, oxalate/formate antiporter